MAKTPTRKPVRRGPANQSRGAGAPAPASAAARAPMEGAHHGEGFYSPEGGAGAPTSGLAAPAAPTAEQADYVGRVKAGAVVLEPGMSADVSLTDEPQADERLEQTIARIRQTRRPFSELQQKLALPKRQGYYRHWFNDSPGRVDEALNNGWSHIKGKDGRHLNRVVGSGRQGGALSAYAMEIPEVFWLEDQAAKNAIAQGRMDGLKGRIAVDQAGDAKPEDATAFYSPQKGIVVSNH